MIDKKSVKKILVIKLRGIGDVVLSTIILDNLIADFPDASIDYLTDPSSKPGLEGLSQINKVVIFPKKGIWSRLKLFLEIRQANYDLVFDFFSNPTTAQITFLSGAKYKVGFPYRGRKYAYNYYGPEERGKYHSAALHLLTLKKLNLTHEFDELHFFIDKSDNSFANKYINDIISADKLLIGLSPSGGWKSKKCDPEKFAEIGNALKEKYNANIIILWGYSDKDEAIEINKLIQNSILAPATSIREMAALIKKCDILIANDSGPMHISTTVGTPVLSIHGPTDPLLQGPYGDKHEWVIYSELDCIKCNLLECPKNHECFKDLPLSRIMEKVDKLILKNKIVIR